MLGPLKRRPAQHPRGLTLVELLVAIAVAGVLLTIAVPSLKDFILVQRLKSVNAQLVTDLQFARAEAAARGQWARIHFSQDDAQSCYTVYTAPNNTSRCDCLAGPGSACSGTLREVRTVVLPRGDGVTLAPAIAGDDNAAMAFDHISGGLAVIPQDIDTQYPDAYDVDTAIEGRTLRTRIGRAGRVTVCASSGSVTGFEACP